MASPAIGAVKIRRSVQNLDIIKVKLIGLDEQVCVEGRVKRRIQISAPGNKK